MSAPPLSEGTKTATLTEVNRGIVQVASESFAHQQEWEFFCECGREECDEYVWLTVEAYSKLHDCGRAVLAAGHSLSQVERARQLSAESEALRRQAEHQVQRARNNLGSEGASDGRR